MPLGEVAQVTAGDPAPQHPEDFSNEGMPFVRMQDVGRYGQTTCLAETKDHLSSLASAKLKRFPSGSILVPKSGASIRLNHRAILGIEAHVVSHLAVIVPHRSLNTRFAYYWLCSTDLSKVAHQADLPSMKTSDLAKLRLPVPPLVEQERIAKFLDQADALRKLRTESDSRTADLIPALFCEMFGDPAHNPKGFATPKFADVSDKIFKGAFDLKQADYRDEGIPFVRISNVQLGSLDLTDAVYISQEIAERYKNCQLSPDDLVFCKVGTIDRIGKVPATVPICVISQNNVGVKLLRKLVNSEYALAYLTSGYALSIIRAGSKKAVQDKLVLSELRSLPFLLPPLKLQEEFARQMMEIRELEVQQIASRQRLDDLFQSMLHRAFNGEL